MIKGKGHNTFSYYAGFCLKCGEYFMRYKKKGNKICINCFNGRGNLCDHYPPEEIKEFMSKNNNFILVDDKVFKLKLPSFIEGEEVISRGQND